MTSRQTPGLAAQISAEYEREIFNLDRSDEYFEWDNSWLDNAKVS